MLSKTSKLIFVATAAGICAEIMYYYYWRMVVKKRNINYTKTNQNRVLFFPDESVAGQNIDGKSCSHQTTTSLSELINVLISANETLDVCVYVITCYSLADAIITTVKKGVNVRIITDDENTQDHFGSQIGKLRASGIAIRCRKKTGFLMHHKFVVVDGKTVVNGSFNWTRQAITVNNENVLISCEENIVKAYSDEFEKLWQQFDPSLAI